MKHNEPGLVATAGTSQPPRTKPTLRLATHQALRKLKLPSCWRHRNRAKKERITTATSRLYICCEVWCSTVVICEWRDLYSAGRCCGYADTSVLPSKQSCVHRALRTNERRSWAKITVSVAQRSN